MTKKTETTEVNGVHLITKDDMVVRAQHQRGSFEPEAFHLWLTKCGEGKCVIDIGAYTGVYSIAAAKEGAMVFSWEPNTFAFDRLRKNIALNGVESRITPYWEALGDRSAVCAISRPPGRFLSSAASVVGDHWGGGRTSHCYMQTLDHYGLVDVDAIKIDAERSEPMILRGAMKTILQSKPLLLIESLDEDEFTAVHSILWHWGYVPTRLGQNMVVWHFDDEQ